ncbi:MAG: hypothetical protein K8H87_16755 [Pseudorhodoplanes sp.]|nr:hypothetical protein [Pseudorhodoplanes sp.]
MERDLAKREPVRRKSARKSEIPDHDPIHTTGANFRPVTREPDPRIRRKKEESSQDDGLLGQARQ